MTRVYIVRHCETEGNSTKAFQGSSDLPVTKIGEKQLEALGERFKGIHIDKIFVSPQLRAKKTALAIANPKGMEISIKDDLREINGGVIEGMTLSDIFKNYRHLEDAWVNVPQDFAPEKGEPMREVYKRMSNIFDELLRENKGKTFVIASHGAAIRNLICYLTKGDIEKLNDIPWCDNTAVSLFEFDDDLTPKMVFFNNTDHLSEELLPKSSKIVAFSGESK